MNKKTLILILTVAIFSLVLFFMLDKESVSLTDEISLEDDRIIKLEAGIKEGEAARDFSLEDMDGKKVSLSDYYGDIIFINFWTSFSEDKGSEIKDLDRIDRENEDLRVLAVNVREDLEVVEKFVEQADLELEILLDKTGEVGLDYPIGKLPMTYVIDRQGRLYKKFGEKMDYDQMLAIVEELRK